MTTESGVDPIDPGLEEETTYQVDVVADLPLPGGTGDFDATGAGYWGYGCVVVYSRDRGLRPQTIAGPSRAFLQEFHRVHTGRGIKTVSGVAIRLFQHPQVPSPLTDDPNEVLLFDELAWFNPQKMINSDLGFAVTWRYLYGLQQWPADYDYLGGSRSPQDPLPATLHTLNPGDFSHLLVGGPTPFSGPVTATGPIAY